MSERLDGKKILVTGSAGFLGSKLCDYLAEKKCDVVGIDNFSFSTNNAKGSVSDRITLEELDITRADKVESFFSNKVFDVIFHLAAVANPRTCKDNFDLAFNVNVVGTKNILQYSKNSKRVLFMSSAAVYGEPISVPIDECHPLNGNDPYATTKIMGENLCSNYVKNYGRSITIARNFNTFGVGQKGDYIIPTLIRQALVEKKLEIWNGNPVRDMMFIDDTINALVTLAAINESGVYNIGTGKGIQIGRLAEVIKEFVNKEMPLTDLKKPVLGSPRLVAGNSKLMGEGWKEAVGFEEGIRRTIEWFKMTL